MVSFAHDQSFWARVVLFVEELITGSDLLLVFAGSPFGLGGGTM